MMSIQANDNDGMLAPDEPQKGKLKIFLGYCAGVGKTYRMLQEAINNKKNNVDVVIGLVETHGRSETAAFLKELEVFPRKEIQYGGIAIAEMDLDSLLLRKPKLVLVDELAHTNIPGARHAKRYQDVEELLNAGIDVFTTLNIQHVQSLIDIVYQITNVKVEEIIPDRILEIADEIELVDLPPEKLQQRMAEGKVYIPQKAKQAMQKFFKKGNLLALRELSLKYTAKRVDIDLLSYREREEILNVWPVESKILVGISSSKITERILLIAHRMATDLEAEWFAVHVESPQQVKTSEKSQAQLYRNIHLAEELGAKVVTLSGNNIAAELVKFAKQKNITLIITGFSQRSRLQEAIKGSVLNKLIKASSPINVLVVGDSEQAKPPTSQYKAKPTDYKKYFWAFLSVVFVGLIGWLFSRWLSPINFLFLMLWPAVVSGILWGPGAGLFATLVALGVVDFFLVPPLYSFTVMDLKLLPSFAFFAVVAIGLSWFGNIIRWRAESARYRERFIYALYHFGREMMIAQTLDDILNRAVKSIAEAFETDVIILLPDKNERLEFVTKSRADLSLNDMEKAVVSWVYKNGRPAGRGTNTLSSAKWHYLPLKIKDKTFGVICIMKLGIEKSISPEKRRLLESFAGIVALAIGRIK